MWCMAALSPWASLPLRGSTVVRTFFLPDRLVVVRVLPLGEKWREILGARAGSLWGRARGAWRSALSIKSCLEAPSTIKGEVLLGIVPQSIFIRDRQRGAIGSSHPAELETFLLRSCQWAMLVEISNAMRYLRTWTRVRGKGNCIEGLA